MTSAVSDISETVALAQRLIRIDTANPPGREAAAAAMLAERLRATGATIRAVPLAPGRNSLVARLGPPEMPALCLCGHLDTVPLGDHPWRRDPLGGEIGHGRLWGRGSTDMKAGVAAMVTAFERVAAALPQAPVVLALCAGEETGCQGAETVIPHLGPVGAMIVAEPTSLSPALGHKGVLWMRLAAAGRAAHASMPHLGVNAIAVMLEALSRLSALDLSAFRDPLLGGATLSMGTISGGTATNIVPDRCEATVDIRLVPGMDVDALLSRCRALCGEGVVLDPVLGLGPVRSDLSDDWVRFVVALAAEARDEAPASNAVAYFTDASVLAPALGFPPVVIIGPGDAALAHQVDESCDVEAIDRASALYEAVARDWTKRISLPSTKGQ